MLLGRSFFGRATTTSVPVAKDVNQDELLGWALAALVLMAWAGICAVAGTYLGWRVAGAILTVSGLGFVAHGIRDVIRASEAKCTSTGSADRQPEP